MPLTNVWTQDQTGEWVRTTAAAMDREYDHTVPVYSHTFRCYNCFQYVTFVKGNEYRISHFKHSRGEEDKDCEDRSFGSGGYTYGSGVTDVPDPMRIQFDGNRAYLEIGFFPVSVATIEKAIAEKEKLTEAPGFWDDHEAAEKVMSQIRRLKNRIEPWKKIIADMDDLEAMYELAAESGEASDEEDEGL